MRSDSCHFYDQPIAKGAKGNNLFQINNEKGCAPTSQITSKTIFCWWVQAVLIFFSFLEIEKRNCIAYGEAIIDQQ